VGFLTVERDDVAFDALGAEDDGERQAEVLEDGPLLDVKFEVGGGVSLFAGRFGETVDFYTATAKGVFELDAVAIPASAIGGNGVGASEGGGAEQAATEARAFFVGPIDQTDGDRRSAAEFFGETAEDFETGEDVERAVKPAAIGGGIEVATDEEAFFGSAWQRGPVVSGGVVVVFDGKLGELFGEPLTGAEPGVRPGDALSTGVVGGERSELFELGDGAFGIKTHERSRFGMGYQVSDIRYQEAREEKRAGCATGNAREPVYVEILRAANDAALRMTIVESAVGVGSKRASRQSKE
jgi:hypothetical protein